jgi:hypothetical protein
MEKENKDTIEIKNLPDFSSILGCFTVDDKYVHLGALFTRRTACGKPMGDTILSRDITVNCPGCVAETRYRSEHPEAAKEELGVVTHKRNK